MYRKASHRVRTQSGVTFFELLAALSVAMILGGLAIPGVQRLRASFNRMNAQAYLAQDLKRAQAESITQGCRGIFSIAADSRSYSFGCDYLPYDTANPPHSDVTTLVRTLPENIIIQSDIPIIFNSKGQAVDVDGIISNINVSMRDATVGALGLEFAAGTLLGTGVFNYS